MLSLTRIRLVCMMFLLSAGTLNVFSAKPGSSSSADEYDVYLLIGQSNMAGRGRMIESDTANVIPGVWLLNDKGQPEPAKNPMNRYSTVRKKMSDQRISPATAFSEKIAAQTGRKILIVMNARGATTIEQWAKDAPKTKVESGVADELQLYSEAIRRAKEGLKYGKLKGILWHQGEGNSGGSKPGRYPDQLKELVRNLRADLNAPDVPFIAGELSYLRGDGKGSTAFNEMIRTIATFIPNSGWVSAEGLAVNSEKDVTHFSREGQLVLGARYADKALELCYPAADQPKTAKKKDGKKKK